MAALVAALIFPPLGAALGALGVCLALATWLPAPAEGAARRRAVSILLFSGLLLTLAWRGSLADMFSHPSRSGAAGGGASTQSLDVTAYCVAGQTAAGTSAAWGTAASPLPLGTRVLVPGYGPATVLDRGPGVGPGQLDLFMPSCPAAQQWGRRSVAVTILPPDPAGNADARHNVR